MDAKRRGGSRKLPPPDRLSAVLAARAVGIVFELVFGNVHESVPVTWRNIEVAVRVGHRTSAILLRAARCPAHHFGYEVLKAGGRHFMVRLIDRGVRIQAGIGHDPVNQVIYYDSNTVNSA